MRKQLGRDVVTFGEMYLGDANRSYFTSLAIGDTFGSGGTNGTVYAMPFIASRRFKVSQIGIIVMTLQAGGLCRTGIYRSDGGGRPRDLIIAGAEHDCSSTGGKFASISTILQDGELYWLAFTCNNGSLAFRSSNFLANGIFGTNSGTDGFYNPVWKASGSYAALPASFPTIDGGQMGSPCVFIRGELFA